MRVYFVLLVALLATCCSATELSTAAFQLQAPCAGVNSTTCCSNMICPYDGGVCCPGNEHCCPSGTECLPVGEGVPQQCGKKSDAPTSCPCAKKQAASEACNCDDADSNKDTTTVIKPTKKEGASSSSVNAGEEVQVSFNRDDSASRRGLKTTAFPVKIQMAVTNFLFPFFTKNKKDVTARLRRDLAGNENVAVSAVEIKSISPLRLRTPSASLLEVAVAHGVEGMSVSGIRVEAIIYAKDEAAQYSIARHFFGSLETNKVALDQLSGLSKACRGNVGAPLGTDRRSSAIFIDDKEVTDVHGIKVAKTALDRAQQTNKEVSNLQREINELEKEVKERSKGQAPTFSSAQDLVNLSAKQRDRLSRDAASRQAAGLKDINVINKEGGVAGGSNSKSFNYNKGGADWGGFCAYGQSQSPIDIDPSKADSVKGESKNMFKLNFKTLGNAKLVNNGHTVQLSGDMGTIDIAGTVYQTKQIVFHAASEHTMVGKKAAAEMQLYLQEKGADGDKEILAIAILFKEGNENDFLKSLNWNALPPQYGDSSLIPGLVDLRKIERAFTGANVVYAGSYTTPPCKEVVTWHVMVEQQQLSPEQLSQLTAIVGVTGNARAVQLPNGRTTFTNLLPSGKNCVVCVQAVPKCSPTCKKCMVTPQTCTKCSSAVCLDNQGKPVAEKSASVSKAVSSSSSASVAAAIKKDKPSKAAPPSPAPPAGSKAAVSSAPVAVTLADKWREYGRGYRMPQVSMVGGVCFLSGLVQSDRLQPGPVLTVPAACAPRMTHIFNQQDNSNLNNRLDLNPNGVLHLHPGSLKGTIITLDGLSWPSKKALDAKQVTRKDISLNGRWTNFGGPYERASYTLSSGFCDIKGLVKVKPEFVKEGFSKSTVIAQLPAECRPKDGRLIFKAACGNTGSSRVDIRPDGKIVWVGGAGNNWLSLGNIKFPVKGSSNLSLLSGYKPYANGYRTPSFSLIGSLCSLSGLINGNGANHITTLPPNCRPKSGRTIFYGNRHSTNLRVDVLPDGRVVRVGKTLSGWLSLEGISFSAVNEESWEKNAEVRVKREQDHAQIRKMKPIKMDVKGVLRINAKSEYRLPQVQRVGDICVLSGTADVSGGVVKGLLAVLPDYCRPDRRAILDFHSTSTAQTIRVDVLNNGQVVAVTNAKSPTLSFDGVSFVVADAKTSPITLNKYWRTHSTTYQKEAFFIENNMCHLEGLINLRSGGAAEWKKNRGANLLFTLPKECRPESRIILLANHHTETFRVDVTPGGQVYFVSGNQIHAWVSLSGLKFPIKTGNALDLKNDYSRYSSSYRNPSVTEIKDVCILSGLAKGPGNSAQRMTTLSTGCRPAARSTFFVNRHGKAVRVDVLPNGQVIRINNKGGWISVDGVSFSSVEQQPWEADLRKKAK